jgi:hypothetical protein
MRAMMLESPRTPATCAHARVRVAKVHACRGVLAVFTRTPHPNLRKRPGRA